MECLVTSRDPKSKKSKFGISDLFHEQMFLLLVVMLPWNCKHLTQFAHCNSSNDLNNKYI